ncbi:MAG: GntR family transcriptional regulator [Pseudomonadota bacterium]
MKAGVNAKPFLPVERGNAAGRVLDDLQGRILRAELARGDKLPTEKQLAEAYAVSGATIREATRALAAMHLVEVRHGSGAYVTADSAQLLAMSLNSLIQIERISVPDVLGVLGVLNAHAAELAAARADSQEVDAMQAALDRIASAAEPADVAAGLSDFLDHLGLASRNPLLAALCKFLAGLQIALAHEISKGSMKQWRETTGKLAADRQQLVNAIRAHDVQAAQQHARTYHQRSVEIISALPDASAARLSAEALGNLMGSFARQP